MSLSVKKQFPEFDIDEYTDKKELTLLEVLTEIKQFDWISEREKSSKMIEEHPEPAIWLKNKAGNMLAVCSQEENKFVIYFSFKRLIWRSSHSLLDGHESVVEVVKLFEDGNNHLLLQRLRASASHQKTLLILDLFQFFTPKEKIRNSREIRNEEFIYEIKYGRVFIKLVLSLAFLFIPSIIWTYASLINNKAFNLVVFLAIQGFFLLLALPGIIIAINHLRKNGNWKVYFRKGDNVFIIVSAAGKEILNKGDFIKRIRVDNPSNAPWSFFEYTTLIDKKGRQLHISDLLIPSSQVEKLFGRIEETVVKNSFQIIKDREVTDV